jgi:type II secretory pathway pseudopilin PulG
MTTELWLFVLAVFAITAAIVIPNLIVWRRRRRD